MEPQAVKLSQFSSSTCGNAVCTGSFFFSGCKKLYFSRDQAQLDVEAAESTMALPRYEQ